MSYSLLKKIIAGLLIFDLCLAIVVGVFWGLAKGIIIGVVLGGLNIVFYRVIAKMEKSKNG
jgi:hypothetical protein